MEDYAAGAGAAAQSMFPTGITVDGNGWIIGTCPMRITTASVRLPSNSHGYFTFIAIGFLLSKLPGCSTGIGSYRK